MSRRNAQEEAYVLGAYNGDDVLILGTVDRNRAGGWPAAQRSCPQDDSPLAAHGAS